MKNKYMFKEKLELLTAALKNVQHLCIGLYYNVYTKEWEPVVDIGEHTFVTMNIGRLLGLQLEYHPTVEEDMKRIVRFTDNKTLADMINTPMVFYSWCKEYLKY